MPAEHPARQPGQLGDDAGPGHPGDPRLRRRARHRRVGQRLRPQPGEDRAARSATSRRCRPAPARLAEVAGPASPAWPSSPARRPGPEGDSRRIPIAIAFGSAGGAALACLYHRRRWPPTSPATTSPTSPAWPGSTLTDDELDRFTGQLAAVLEHAARRRGPRHRRRARRPPTPTRCVNVLRADVVRPEPRPRRGARPAPAPSRTAASGCPPILGEEP